MGKHITKETLVEVFKDFVVPIDKKASGGGATLYDGTGQNTDGAMTQKATTDALDTLSTSAAGAIYDLDMSMGELTDLETTAKDKLVSAINELEREKQDALTFDSTPTMGSSNPVTSAGIKAAIDASGSGGSTITVTAEDSELYGGTVTVTDGTSTKTGTISSGGTALFTGVTMTGTLQISVTNGEYEGAATLSAPYYGNYSVSVAAADIYTLNISTSESTLHGQTVTATDGTNVKTGTISSGGTATLRITFTGSVTVTATDGDQTASSTVTVSSGTDSYNVSLSFVKIYGVEWDGTSTTAWSRTDDAAMFVDPVPYVAGASSYGSPFDTLMPWSGMVSGERAGGTMVSIPKFWYKITQNGSGMKIQIADKAKDGFSVSPAHMDRGDGEREYVFVGRYHCASDYKSKTGSAPKANITRSTARSGIHALGSNIWQMDFATRFTIWLLYIVEFANWHSQVKIGYGCGNNSAAQSMGYTDSMPYHTGTMQSSRTAYGLGTQYRYIEGLWDNVYDWMDGCYYNSNGMSVILNPANFSDSSGGTGIGTPSSGWPSAFTVKDVSGAFPCFIPTAASGSENTFSCDSWNFSGSSPCLCVGGGYSQSQYRGLFFVNCSSTSHAGANFGCRLLELP